MDVEWVREYCLSLPHTTERVQWEDNLVLKMGGRMYAILALEPGACWLSFKCSDESFAEMLEVPGVVPARYLARAKWVSLETETALRPQEVKQCLRRAHELIFARLPRKTQSALRQGSKAPRARTRARR